MSSILLTRWRHYLRVIFENVSFNLFIYQKRHRLHITPITFPPNLMNFLMPAARPVVKTVVCALCCPCALHRRDRRASGDVMVAYVSATLFFLPQHIIFSKNIVLWQVCHNTLLFESQHIIFSKKYCVADMAHNTISFKIIMCCDSKSNVLWQTCHNTIFLEKIMCCGGKNKVADATILV